MVHISFLFFFFFNDTATTEIYTLSLHDALPIFQAHLLVLLGRLVAPGQVDQVLDQPRELLDLGDDVPEQPLALHRREVGRTLDRKSTRLNSSHSQISYAVFCLKKKKTIIILLYH